MKTFQELASNLDKLPSASPRPNSVFDSQWLNLSCGRLRYVELGKKQASHSVIMMPDPPNTIEHMEEVMRLLAKDFRVVVIEGPGFGFSRASLGYDFSFDENAEMFLELINKLELRNVILALTCVAALPGLLAARREPEQIVGLVLGQTPSLDEAKRWARRVDFKGLLGTAFAGQIVLRLARNKIADTWYRNALDRNTDRQPFTNQATRAFRQGARFSLASAFQAILRDTKRSTDITVNQPAIVLWGTLDRTHRKTNPHAILDMLPQGKLIELENCAHFPDIEVPEQFAAAVKEIAERSRQST